MEDAIEAVRLFNRFFTQHVGAIDDRFLDTETNLPEARLLFEIARREPVFASELQSELRLDRGYLSRMLTRLEERGWISRDKSTGDARSRNIRLMPLGRAAFEHLNQRQRDAVAHDLSKLSSLEQADLVEALTKARLLLDKGVSQDYTIRPAKTGEVSAVASRQSRLYAESHNWGRGLEILEAETTAAFLRNFKPGREQCWIADLGGVMAGAVFLTDEGGGSARLRLLHVESFARRRGIGDRLVRTCIEFACDKGYDRIMLWTHTVLESARRIYQRHGFEITSSDVHHEFGEPVHGETWELIIKQS